MNFIFIAIIILFILEYNKKIDTRKFVNDTEPYFRFLMEDDYKFLLTVKYGNDVDVNKLFGIRVRNGFLMIIFFIFLFLNKFTFIYFIFAVIIGYLVFKMPYTQLRRFYNSNLYKINLMLPYYLKGLEILIQHYTVPVALNRSITTAPEMFKPGLEKMVARIEEGDSSVDPYMDFAKEYPVRDSMRMMRLLYRLGLGSQENKHEQLLMFSKTVSNLQNKAREQKYKDRLEKMENKTMQMLFATGGGILALMLFAMMMMMQF
ncbi:MAG: hypothetical protein HFI87_02570 [Bacilli bacterium]|nr:hypothetical protein [Bacilli bacterium]